MEEHREYEHQAQQRWRWRSPGSLFVFVFVFVKTRLYKYLRIPSTDSLQGLIYAVGGYDGNSRQCLSSVEVTPVVLSTPPPPHSLSHPIPSSVLTVT